MTAVASMGGVIAAAEPGGVPTALPFSDAFTRANGDPGRPWYRPGCKDSLQIVSDTLQATVANDQLLSLLLDSDDFDLSYDVTYSASSAGVRDDVNVAFRLDACAPNVAAAVPTPNGSGLLVATNPGDSGTNGITVLSESGGSFSTVYNAGTGITEAATFTFRLVLIGSSLRVYVNGVFYFAATVAALPGQRALQFFVTRVGTKIDNVSIVTPSAPLVTDLFDRADNSTSLGNADSGQTWVPSTSVFGGLGVFGIDTHQAFATYSAGRFNVALIDSSTADVNVAAELLLSTGHYHLALMLRANDANNCIYCAVGGSGTTATVGMQKIVAGTQTLLATTTHAVTPGTPMAYSMIASGNSVQVFLGGSLVLSYTLTPAEMATFLGSATKQGLATYTDTAANGGDDGTSRWDNYTVN